MRSKIYDHKPDELQTMLNTFISYSEILKHIGLRAAGGNIETLKRIISEYNLDTSQMEKKRKEYLDSKLNRQGFKRQIFSNHILVQNSFYSRNTLRSVLRREGVLEYKCQICKLADQWNGIPLVLQIDHINGIYNDNRVENLRWLCPNCHSQTPTFAGKKNVKTKPAISPVRKRVLRPSQERIQWPLDDSLRELVWQKPRSTLAKELGVSDVAIAKRCRNRGIDQPPRGHWSK